MPGHSALTRKLIAAGLRRPASAEPLTDALQATQAAYLSIEAGRLAEASAHLDNAKHAIASARITGERAA